MATKYDWSTVPDPVMFPDRFAKFEDKNDSIAGTVDAIRLHKFEGDAEETLLVDLDCGDERVSVALGKVDLLAKVKAAAPQVGDHLAITYTGKKPTRGGGFMKIFDVTCKRAADSYEPGEDPF